MNSRRRRSADTPYTSWGGSACGTNAASRKKDHDRTIGFTDAVVKIFSNEWLALAAARNIGLALLDHIPAAKTLLTRHAMGLAGHIPRLGKNS